jgi:hypothetical protein
VISVRQPVCIFLSEPIGHRHPGIHQQARHCGQAPRVLQAVGIAADLAECQGHAPSRAVAGPKAQKKRGQRKSVPLDLVVIG